MKRFAVSLLLAATLSASAQDQVERLPVPPREVPQVRYNMPVLMPMEFAAAWSDTISDLKKKAAAPAEDHFIADAATWTKLWKAWRGDEKVPTVNFQEEVLFVFTALGPNVPILRLYKNGSHVGGVVARTVKGGPGFGYHIVKVPRAGIKTFFDKTLE
jgi:hypothetical protein